MRINRVEANKLLTFKSIRTDRNTVEQLKNGEKPIIENNRQNILSALTNLGSQPNRTNIEFLLDIADNLAYGQGGEDSEFQSALDEDGFSPSERENNDWNKALKDTISLALSTSQDDVSDLQTEFDRIFAPKKELTDEQKEILSLRKGLTAAILSDNTLEDVETLTRTTNILKNLDYFVASSEIPTKQKTEVLGKLIHFMSDEYKINPQLQDKKTQVVDEMLGDMIIKTPESDVLTIKPVDQRHSGICAAISICRKYMAYEDKSRYVDLIMEELSASDRMKIFDITELGTGKQVEIVKPEIEYTTALKDGYRIIDTSAHIWMHNAHSSGDGTIQTEYYVAFDDDNYGIFNDSSWYLGIGEDLLPEKLFLTALIKEGRYLESFKKTQKEYKEAQRSISTVKKEAIQTQSAARGAIVSILSDVFPEKQNKEIAHLFSLIIDFYNGKTDENEVNVAKQLPKEVKQQIIADFISQSVGNSTEEQTEKINQKSSEMLGFIEEYTQADAKVEKLQSFNTKRGKYVYNKKLFNVAAAHRIAMESDINTPNAVVRWEKSVGLPPRDIQISNHLAKTQVKDETQRKELMSDIMYLDSVAPKEIDEITTTLLGHRVQDLAYMMFKNLEQGVQSGNSDAVKNARELLNLSDKKGQNEVLKEIQNWASKLENNPNDETVLEAIRTLGYEDRTQYVNIFIVEYFNSLRKGISEEEAESLAEKFGGFDKISKGLETQRVNFENIKKKQAGILEKWQVPTARELILDRLEKKYNLISRSKLDKLKNRFDTIQNGMNQNEKIANSKQRAKANEKLYTFTTEEQEILDQIEKQVSSMKKYQKINYLSVNKALAKDLDAQYANIGMLNGDFWVREEGSSGLAANEQNRIIEQMTGKPHHIVRNVKDAAKQIKEGKGSGVISMSVLHDDYGFHAQYVPSVSSETMIDTKTGDRIIRDIVWTDNSWGNAEKNSFWNGHDGFLHTDYGSGYGWENGFLLAPDQRIGLAVDDIHGATGVAVNDDNEKFGLFTDVVLEGMPVDATQKLFKVFNYILNMEDAGTALAGLEAALTSGYKFSMKELEGLDDLTEIKYERISKRAEKEINSQEEYDALPNDDELKFAFDKIALMMATTNPTFSDGILVVDTPEALDKIAEELFQASVENMAGLVCKSDTTFDTVFATASPELEGLFIELESKFNLSIPRDEQEKIANEIFYDPEAANDFDGTLKGLAQFLSNRVVQTTMKYIQDDDAQYFFVNNAQKIIFDKIEKHVKIKSLDDPILQNSPMGEFLIKSIDRHLQTRTDKELLDYIQALQHANFDVADKFFDMLEPEDVGVDIKSGYEYLKLYKADNTNVAKALQDSIATQEIYKNLRTADETGKSTPEECFRDLYVKLADMDVQKYVKGFKSEFFRRYKVRQAFPEPVVLKDADITKYLAQNIIAIQQGVNTISDQQIGIDILSTYHKIFDDFSDKPVFNSLLKKDDVVITDSNKDEINALAQEFITLSTLTAMDTTIKKLNEKISGLVTELYAEEKISGRKAGKLLKEVLTEFENIEKSGNTVEKYVQDKQTAIKALNKQVDFLVTANIDPKHRNEARHRFNKLIAAYKDQVSTEEIDELEQQLDDIFTEKHIVKNPKVLLREVTQMLLDGKQNTLAYNALRQYLSNALQVAQQTKIQYKLVQNQHEAISSKTKNLLGLFSVYDKEGKKHSMNSELGMVYFVERLRNENDNHVTLNLFLEQSGLTTRALEALVNTMDLNETKADLEDRISEIKTSISNLDKFANISEAYFSRMHLPRKTWRDTVEQFITYVQRQLKEYKDTPLYVYYMECLEAAKNMDNFDEQSRSLFNDILRDGNTEALYQTAQTINAEISELDKCADDLHDRAELICSIRVPRNSMASKKRSQFMRQYDEIGSYLESENNVLQALISNSQALATMQY